MEIDGNLHFFKNYYSWKLQTLLGLFLNAIENVANMKFMNR